ncbi:MAG: AIR synthase related protein [Candidatus Woesearchaeota archaeon]
MTKDEYRTETIFEGDRVSRFLRTATEETLRNSEYVDVVNGNRIVRPPRGPTGYSIVVCSAVGDDTGAIEMHGASLVDNLYNALVSFGATPVGFSNIIDVPKVEMGDIEELVWGMRDRANERKMVILNGEYAVLGDMVTSNVSVLGTGIGLIHTGDLQSSHGSLTHEGVQFSYFNPRGQAVFLNSDGTGTKPILYLKGMTQGGSLNGAVDDYMAMTFYDAIKMGGVIQVSSAIIETTGDIPFEQMDRYAWRRAAQMGVTSIMERHYAQLRSFPGEERAFNINGSTVSTISEERLQNPLKCNAGDSLVAVYGRATPRSNGISSRRRTMDALGNDWHTKPENQAMLRYLTTHSTVFYPVFSKFVDQGLATGLFHLSGGSYDGKLARPLRRQGLAVELTDLPHPCEQEIELVMRSGKSMEDAYGQWNMRVEGFVATPEPARVFELLRQEGLEGKVVGKLEPQSGDRTGVRLTAFNGEKVHFDGLEKAA